MKKQRILIIGGCGYIGSAIFNRLLNTAGYRYEVDTVDLEWFGNYVNPNNFVMDVKDLSKEFLNSYDCIIMLSGHSSSPMATNSPLMSTFKNNVENFISLLGKLKNHQKVIYASSASVYNGLAGIVTEDNMLKSPSSVYDLTKQEVDHYVMLKLFPDLQLYGLRFATVGGYSSNQRTDTMVNMMVRTANEKGSIFVLNGQSRRPILYIEDLVDAVINILDCKDDRSGIYNLASVNATIQSIAEVVANELNVEITQSDEKSFSGLLGGKKMPPSADFAIDSTKIQKVFDIQLNASIETIVKNLQKNFKKVNLETSTRAMGVEYE
jgi:nucleoside-diphosphate-sugar epimerase